MASSRPVLFALAAALLITPALAGCLSGSGDEALAPAATTGGGAAGGASALAGQSAVGPTAPKEAFVVAQETGKAATTIHPFTVPGQVARAAEHVVFEGVFDPQDCSAGPVSWFTGEFFRFHEFKDKLKPGDAVDANVTLRYTNGDGNFADMHLWVEVPGQFHYHSDSVGDARGEIAQSFAFQFAYPGEESDPAAAGIECWYAANAQPIPYTIDVHLVFAQGVMPAATPHLVRVSENVKELRVFGVPSAPGATVTGHYRVYGPDDALIGALALNTGEAYDAVNVTAPGNYVLIVDHSDGGMLGVGADAAPEDPTLVILKQQWNEVVDYATATPGPVDATVKTNFPRVPLAIFPWMRAAENNVVAGKKITIDMDGPAGRVWHIVMPTRLGLNAPTPGINLGIGLPDGTTDFEMRYDHHALAQGEHTVRVQADAFHGEVFHWYVTYLRPGEEGPPAPTAGAGNGARDAAAAPPGAPSLRALLA